MKIITLCFLTALTLVLTGCGSRDQSSLIEQINHSTSYQDLYSKIYSDKELQQLSALKILPKDMPDGYIVSFVPNLDIDWVAPKDNTLIHSDGRALSKEFDLLPKVNPQYKRLTAYLCQKYGLEVHGQSFITENNFAWIKLQPQNTFEPSTLLRMVLANESTYVTSINHNWVKRTSGFPDDPWVKSNPYQWYHYFAEIDKIWDIETGKNNVVVAVLDTGVRRTHNDLNDGRVMTFSPGTNADVVDNDNDPNDEDEWANGHGTGCAGIIGQISNNQYMGAGVAQNVTIMPVRCMNKNGIGNDFLTSAAVNFSVTQGAKIINMSLGGEGSSPQLQNACNNAWNKGILLLAAGGNSYTEGNPYEYPAGYTSVMGVGAAWPNDWYNPNINQDWKRCDFSNDQDYIEVAAAGIGIPVLNRVSDSGYFDSVMGTSQACPIVAGVAALLWSFKPDFTNAQIRDIIKTKVSVCTGFANAPTAGRLDGKKIADYMQTFISFPDVFFSNPTANSVIPDGKSFSVSLLNGETLSKVDYYLDGKFVISNNAAPFDTAIGTNKIGNKRAVLEAWCYISGMTEPKVFTTTVDIVNLYGDTNTDNVVDSKDVAPVLQAFGKKAGDADYRGFIDANLDGVIDERDLTKIGQFYGREL